MCCLSKSSPLATVPLPCTFDVCTVTPVGIRRLLLLAVAGTKQESSTLSTLTTKQMTAARGPAPSWLTSGDCITTNASLDGLLSMHLLLVALVNIAPNTGQAFDCPNSSGISAVCHACMRIDCAVP